MIDSFDNIILTGGALENPLFSSILQELFDKKANWFVNIPENPQFANVYGFYLIAESIIQRNKKEQMILMKGVGNEKDF